MNQLTAPFNEITPTLFISSYATASNKTAVLNSKIKLIVNAASELPCISWNNEIDVIQIPVRDTSDALLAPYFDEVADAINERTKKGERCLVHCVAGISRSATLCIAYLIKYHKMSLRKAYYHVLSCRDCIFPNFGFWHQLIEYEKKVRKTTSVKLVPSPFGTELVPDIYVHQKRKWFSCCKM